MRSLPLEESQSVKLVSPGRGSVLFQPQRFDERWVIKTVSVSCTSNALEPRCVFYRDSSEIPSGMINGTYSGSFDTDNDFNYTLQPGNILYVVWTGGVTGSTATCTLTGEKVVGR